MDNKNLSEVDNRINVLIQMLKCIDTAGLTIYTPDFQVVESTLEHVDVMSSFFALGVDRKMYADASVNEMEVISQLRNHFAPNVFINELGLMWISDVWIEENAVKQIYLLGPVFIDDIAANEIEKKLTKHLLSVKLKHQIVNFITEMPVVSLNRMYEYGIMLHYCITNEKIMVSDYWYPKISEAEDEQTLLEPKHGTYIAEQRILKLVEEGNLGYRSVLDSYISTGEVGRYSTGQYLRQEKNTIIIFITLCSRAAIRGGVNSETAYNLSDMYIRNVEQANDIATLTLINREMVQDFVVRVHRIRHTTAKISPRIQKTCDYIGVNLDKKIDIGQLAKMAGYTDYYYSDKFRQEVGKSVRKYIMECKMEKAKELLLQTTMTIQEISELLGYANQSYFGEIFRKQSGISPSAFRERSMKKES